MTDIFTKEKRSQIMASVHSSRTTPELIVKKALKGKGFSYQPKANGSPDFINNKKKIAIFVNGCFWHGCKKCKKMPKTNKTYWTRKINGNVARDKINKAQLRKRGYRVVIIWEHQLKGKVKPKQLRILIE